MSNCLLVVYSQGYDHGDSDDFFVFVGNCLVSHGISCWLMNVGLMSAV